MICEKCGTTIPEGSRFCPTCGAAVSSFGTTQSFEAGSSQQGYNQQGYTQQGYTQQPYYNAPQTAPAQPDAPSTGFGILSFFFPLVGLILYLVWKDDSPLKAKSAGKGALIGLIVSVVMVVLLLVIMPIALMGLAGEF